jgi:hypothetical protein
MKISMKIYETTSLIILIYAKLLDYSYICKNAEPFNVLMSIF